MTCHLELWCSWWSCHKHMSRNLRTDQHFDPFASTILLQFSSNSINKEMVFFNPIQMHPTIVVSIWLKYYLCFADIWARRNNCVLQWIKSYHKPILWITSSPLVYSILTLTQSVGRHDICQKIYATAVLAERILRKKSVNRDIRQFATKERKCFKMA